MYLSRVPSHNSYLAACRPWCKAPASPATPVAVQETFAGLLRQGALEDTHIDIDATPPRQPLHMEGGAQGMQDMFVNIRQMFSEQRNRGEKRRMTVAMARPLISAQEADTMLNQDEVQPSCVHRFP